MKRTQGSYPRNEAFLRYAAANCGVPAIYQNTHEAVEPEAALTFWVFNQPQNVPERLLRAVQIKVATVRSGELAVNRACLDRPFEGVVTASDHKELRRGRQIIGLVSQGCEALLVDASNQPEMAYLVDSFKDPAFRELVTV